MRFTDLETQFRNQIEEMQRTKSERDAIAEDHEHLTSQFRQQSDNLKVPL